MHSNLFDLCNLISGGTDPKKDGTGSGTQLKLMELGPVPRGARNGAGRQLYPALYKNVNLVVLDESFLQFFFLN